MAQDRDRFASFDRVRREMEELFGEVFPGAGLAPRGRTGFVPRVDVYYRGDPPRAVVEVDLAGVDPERIGLEVTGRQLVISGHRPPPAAEGRRYQQVEVPYGPFRRAIELGADVRAEDASAEYADGILRVQLPLEQQAPRSVPISPRTTRRES